MSKTSNVLRLRLWITLSVVCAWAVSVQAENAPSFPTDAACWINSGPLTTSGIKGKGVILWFFEEEDPMCRNQWPVLQKAAARYEGRPLIFIAVNSGRQPQEIEGYAQECDIKSPWIVMVDTNRDFEKACGLAKEIGPDNTSAYRYINAGGEIEAPVKEDFDEVAQKALEGAEWKINPVSMPESLKQAWFQVEMGNYKGLGASLKKAQASKKNDIKEAAKTLSDAVQKEISDRVEAMKEAKEGGNAFHAHELASELSDRFNGFDLPKDVATVKKELAKDAKVLAGVAAGKALEAARKQLASGESGGKSKIHEKAIKALEKIVNDFPDTNLAKHAQALIDAHR